jgi:hypothetical protein
MEKLLIFNSGFAFFRGLSLYNLQGEGSVPLPQVLEIITFFPLHEISRFSYRHEEFEEIFVLNKVTIYYKIKTFDQS